MDRRHWLAVAALWLAAAASPSASRAQTPPVASGVETAVPAPPRQGGQQTTTAHDSVPDAETSEPDAVLSQLVTEALAANPDVLGAAEAIAAARTRPAQARSLADPVVSVQYTNDGWTPTLGEMAMTTLAFMGSQTLPWPGKRGLREAVAATEVAQAQERVERARLTVAAAVKRTYWALALARETLALLGEQAEIWTEAEAAARARYAVGQGAQQDVLRAQLEITRFEQRRVEQEAQVETRTAELNRLLGRAVDAPPPPSPRLALRARPFELAALFTDAESRSPELRAAAVAGERERLSAQLARKEFRPDITVQAGYMNRGGLDPMWQAGVGVNLPVHRDRRRAEVAEAEARGRAAQRQAESVRAQLRYRTQERVAQLRAAERQARLYEQGLIPQARLSYEAAIASYQAGRVPFLTVLEALSSLYSERAGHIALLAAHEQIHVALEEASLEATSALPGAGGAGMAPAFVASMSSAPAGASGATAGASASSGMAMGQ